MAHKKNKPTPVTKNCQEFHGTMKQIKFKKKSLKSLKVKN